MLLLSYTNGMLMALTIAVGYYFRSLEVARFSAVFAGMAGPMAFSTVYLYIFDMLPQHVNYAGYVTEQSFNIIFAYIYPMLLTEETTYDQWAMIFGIYAGVSCLLLVLCWIFLIETDGLSKTQIYKLLRKGENQTHPDEDSE